MHFSDLIDLKIQNDRNPRSLRDIRKGKYPDLETVDQDETLGSNSHLNYSLWNSHENIFVTDHHSKSLAPWIISENVWIGETLLIHIDYHRDERSYKTDPKLMQKAFEQKDVVKFSNLGNVSEVMYIVEDFDLADEVYHWGDPRTNREEVVNHLEDLQPSFEHYDRIILDVDLDVFVGLEEESPYGEWELEDYHSAISELENVADLTTYATSPSFIDQEKALYHLESIRDY